MNSNKQVALISENEELHKTFRRAFKYLENIDLLKNMQEGKDNRKIIIVYAEDRNSLYRYLWNDVRVSYKKKNPIIALSYHKLDSSEDLRDKVFEKLWRSHAYFQIPFNLKELLESFKQLTPLKNIRQTIKDYADNQGLLVIAFHDLRELLGGREELSPAERKVKTCSLLSKIKEILVINKEILRRIDNIVSQVKQSNMSEEERTKFISLIQKLEKDVFQ